MRIFASLLFALLLFSRISATDITKYVFTVVATNGEDSQLGSAVLVDPKQGVYITAYHTLKRVSGGKLYIKVSGIALSADIMGVAKKDGRDLIVFRGPVFHHLEPLKIQLPDANAAVIAVGYRPVLDTMTRRVTHGSVEGISTWKILSSTEGEGGMSGGGLFHGNTLVGLITDIDDRGRIIGANADFINFCLEVTKDREAGKVVDIDKLMPKG